MGIKAQMAAPRKGGEPGAPPSSRDPDRPSNPADSPLTMLVFSNDDAVQSLAAEAAVPPWSVERCTDVGESRSRLVKPGVRLVVVDDAAIEESTRGWVLEQIRKYAVRAMVVYIASDHSDQSERRARAFPVQYYTSKPLDHDRALRVLQSFVVRSSH
ncbi:MAG TPA: hypothetical protein VEC38_01100 [Candidatus Binataceae bacterium]|nr:hypothetical protein [Candidatus Binataceae bacterium]